MSALDAAMGELQDWYDGSRPGEGREPERYVVCAGLAVLEPMRGTFPLARSDYITPGNQVKTGRAFIQGILRRYGENRLYAAEGGRTTRGTVPAADALANRLNQLQELRSLTPDQRVIVIDALQSWLADRAKDYFNRQRLTVDIDISKPVAQIVAAILEAAGRGKAGAVAQHLVGAKLALRYREHGIEVENHSYTTADLQLGRPGDFAIRDAVFHVTIAPMPAVIDKCRQNIRNGRRAYLLVPDALLQAARQLAAVEGLSDSIGLDSSIESFVGQNVEEMGEYDRQKLVQTLRELLAEYNRRVAAVETDQSLLLEIPDYLK